jgi:SAM-dependent methyltransferase
MISDLQRLYSPAFYAQFDDESSRAARVCVPLIVELLKPKSVVDVGCGIGQWLGEFAARGVEDYLGIDGPHIKDDQLRIPRERFRRDDLAQPLRLEHSFDLALSLEVAEHLPPSRADAFVELLARAAPAVVFSAAVPRQGGFGHVNEQWPWYWKQLFSRLGYVQLDPFRKTIWRNPAVACYYQQNLLLYVNPSIHGAVIDAVGVPDKNDELTLVRTAILQEITAPGPVMRFAGRAARRLRKVFGRTNPVRANG